MSFDPEGPLLVQPVHSHAVGVVTIAVVCDADGGVLVSCLVGTQPG